MKLSNEAVLEYQQIYYTVFGIKLSLDEASEKASEFLRLFKVVYQPVNKNQNSGDKI